MLKNLSLKSQLGAGFAVVVALFLATMVFVAQLVAHLEKGVTGLNETDLPLLLAVERMNLSRSEVQQFLTDVSATHDPEAYAEAEEFLKAYRTASQEVRQILARSGDQATAARLDTMDKDFTTFYDSGKAMAEAYIRDGLEAGNRLMKGSGGQPGFDQASERIAEQIEALREVALKQAHQTVASDLGQTRRIEWVMLFGGALATLAATVLAIWIVLTVYAQIGGEPRFAVKLMQRIGAGNLGSNIRLRQGDTRSLMASAAAMQASLRTVVSEVREHAHAVEDTCTELESGGTIWPAVPRHRPIRWP